MALIINMRELEDGDIEMEGILPLEELEIDIHDELIVVAGGLEYDFTVQSMEGGLLVRGIFTLPLKCECSRCLKPYDSNLSLTDWSIHIPLEGDDAVAVVNDTVDLTPAVREDILLEFPQHPLCDPECKGLAKVTVAGVNTTAEKVDEPGPSPWSELNKLQL